MVKKKLHYKNKILFQTNENIWNSNRIFKSNKKKWIVFKRKQLNSNSTEKPESRKNLYKSRLLAKQKFKKFYGDLHDYQLKNLLNKSTSSTNRMQNISVLLEKRIDTILYRLNLTLSILESKKLITNKKVFVNGLQILSPNLILKTGDFIFIKNKLDNNKKRIDVPYLEWNHKINSGVLLREPKFSEIKYSFKPNLSLIQEFYKK